MGIVYLATEMTMDFILIIFSIFLLSAGLMLRSLKKRLNTNQKKDIVPLLGVRRIIENKGIKK